MIQTTLPLLVVLLHVVSGKHFVSNVQQNYDMEINKLLLVQIQKELSASYIYQAYASFFQRADVSLPGISKFFSDASLEERGHAQSLIDYINKRGGYTEFGNIDIISACNAVTTFITTDSSNLTSRANPMCICSYVSSLSKEECINTRTSWKEGLMAFEDALATERYVNNELLNIHQKADKENDAHLTHILEHEFLEEQVSSIDKLARYVTRLHSFARGGNYKLGEYIFDQHLADGK